jgi:hypothetical protein
MRFTAVFLSVFASSMFCGTAHAQAGIDLSPATSVPTADPTPAPAPAIAASPEIASTSSPPAPQPEPQSALSPALAASSASSAFQNGIAAFQKNDFKSARQWFRETLTKDPTQIVAWYDLGLAEQHLGNTGLAIAFWRKALALSPTFSTAKHALTFTRAKLEHSDIPHDVETWESLRSVVLVYASSGQFALGAALIFFISGWFGLMFIGRRRRAILDEKPLPAAPIGALLAAVLFVVFFGLTICKMIDDQDLRGTVIVKKVEAKALPELTSTSLFDLYEGLEVIVRQTRKDWIQVTYPGGATGWISRDSLFTTADKVAP